MVRKYPIGLQHFRDIRKGGYVYIDKTEYIYNLTEEGLNYFLSRPSNFGKSLLVDTIAELFKGSKSLFEGLWIYDKWDWTKTHPVIHFNFPQLNVNSKGLKAAIYLELKQNATRLGISLSEISYSQQFRELIEKAAKIAKVVILIDAHDRPITEFVEVPGSINENRLILENFYSILKNSGNHIQFFLMTGVTQFNCPSIFSSSLDHLRDITLSNSFGGISGFTQYELEINFASEINELQKGRSDILAQIENWYSGYTWNMQTWVYNPFSVLNFMRSSVIGNYWITSCESDLLQKVLEGFSRYDVEDIQVGSLALSSFNIDNPNIVALFQMGILTVKKISPNEGVYELGFPNLEVADYLSIVRI